MNNIKEVRFSGMNDLLLSLEDTLDKCIINHGNEITLTADQVRVLADTLSGIPTMIDELTSDAFSKGFDAGEAYCKDPVQAFKDAVNKMTEGGKIG